MLQHPPVPQKVVLVPLSVLAAKVVSDRVGIYLLEILLFAKLQQLRRNGHLRDQADKVASRRQLKMEMRQ
jgi:hypothetical protein